MISIRNIEMYRDGGTIGIEGYISHKDYNLSSYTSKEPIITVDYRMGTKNPGEWYFGWANKGGTLIQDEEFKELVKQAIQNHIDHMQRMLSKIK
jgi:hypothetical protein